MFLLGVSIFESIHSMYDENRTNPYRKRSLNAQHANMHANDGSVDFP